MLKKLVSLKELDCINFEIDFHSYKNENICGSVAVFSEKANLFKDGDKLQILDSIFTCFEVEYHTEDNQYNWLYTFSLDLK